MEKQENHKIASYPRQRIPQVGKYVTFVDLEFWKKQIGFSRGWVVAEAKSESQQFNFKN